MFYQNLIFNMRLLIIYVITLILGIIIAQNNGFSLSVVDYIILILNLIIFCQLKNRFNRVMVYFWLFWMLLGNFSSYFSYVLIPTSSIISTALANHVYLIFVLFFQIVLYITEFTFGNKANNLSLYKGDFTKNNLLQIFLSIFPFLLLAEVYYRLGYFPILSSDNIVDEMYILNYGILAKYFWELTIFSAIFAFNNIKESKSKALKCLFLFVCLISIFATIFNGARIRLLIIILSIMIMEFKNIQKIDIKKYLIFGVVVIFIYVGIELFRLGNTFNFNNFVYKLHLIGGEYKDWAYTMNSLNGTKLENYDWFLSSIIKLFSKEFINMIGVDFDTIASMDSASYFKNYFSAIWGIRIGIIGELYYAYGYFGGIIVFSIIGFVFGYINYKINNIRNIDSLIFLSVIFSLNLFTIMGQSSTYFSVLKSLLYIFVLFLYFSLVRKVVKKT